MARKYEVFIEDRPVRFGGNAPSTAHPSGLQRVTRLDEMAAGIDRHRCEPFVEATWIDVEDAGRAWEVFQHWFSPVQAAGGIVMDPGGRLLVMRRLGRWDLPKGKVDEGETIEEAALREVREECGLEALTLGPFLGSTWHTYHRNGRDHLKRTDWYAMTVPDGQPLVPQTEEGIDELRWIGPEELDPVVEGTYASLRPVFSVWAEQVRRYRTG